MNPYTMRIDAVIEVLRQQHIGVKKIVRTKGDVTDPEIILTDKRVIQVGLTMVTLYGVPIRRGVLGPRICTISGGSSQLDALQNHLLSTKEPRT